MLGEAASARSDHFVNRRVRRGEKRGSGERSSIPRRVLKHLRDAEGCVAMVWWAASVSSVSTSASLATGTAVWAAAPLSPSAQGPSDQGLSQVRFFPAVAGTSAVGCRGLSSSYKL